MEVSARRRAENESRFRAANEQIGTKAVELGIHEQVPFLCECADEACREILRLSVEEMRQIRRSPIRFAIAPGHDAGPDEVVERRDGVAIVEKRGDEARVLQGEEEARAGGS